MQSAYLVLRTHGLPEIKIMSNLKHKKQDTSILIDHKAIL